MKRQGKTWRMSWAEFREKEFRVILDDIKHIEDNLDTLYRGKDSRAKIEKQIRIFNNRKKTFGQYDLELGKRIISSNIDNWCNISSKSADLDDIMTRIIMTNNGCNCICFSFLSNNNNITEDFARDVEYVCSGMFKFDDWDDSHVNAVVNAMNKHYGESAKKNKRLLKLYNEYEIVDNLKHKLNWDDINREILTGEEMREKYKNLIIHSVSYYKRRDEDRLEEEL